MGRMMGAFLICSLAGIAGCTEVAEPVVVAQGAALSIDEIVARDARERAVIEASARAAADAIVADANRDWKARGTARQIITERPEPVPIFIVPVKSKNPAEEVEVVWQYSKQGKVVRTSYVYELGGCQIERLTEPDYAFAAVFTITRHATSTSSESIVVQLPYEIPKGYRIASAEEVKKKVEPEAPNFQWGMFGHGYSNQKRSPLQLPWPDEPIPDVLAALNEVRFEKPVETVTTQKLSLSYSVQRWQWEWDRGLSMKK